MTYSPEMTFNRFSLFLQSLIRSPMPAVAAVLAMLTGGLLFSGAAAAQNGFSYEEAYPGVNYSTAPLDDRVTRLVREIKAGNVQLDYGGETRGYLDSLLAALDIDPSSQFLVFSKTALKTRFVTAKTPRALYFNDDTYIGFTQNSRSLEVAAMDPTLGPVFFDFSQSPEEQGGLKREMSRCLRCHDTYSMTGGGVPRFLLSSVLADPQGEIVAHEASIITDTSIPLKRRWGGFYVTGTEGSQETMGNFIVDDVAKLRNMDLVSNGNKLDLSDYLDTGVYIRGTSDIVALLVVEHQVEVQNRLSRLNFEARTRLFQNGMLSDEELKELTQPLLESLFMVHEAALTDRVAGSSGFAEYFQSLGPVDSRGRSLRQLDLKTRTFKYPLSYQIYSRAFNALPDPVKNYLYGRIRRVLTGADTDPVFAQLTQSDRSAILDILRDTKPDFPAG